MQLMRPIPSPWKLRDPKQILKHFISTLSLAEIFTA